MKVLRTVLILLVAVALGVLGAQWLSHQNSYDLGNVVVSVGGNDYHAAMPQAVLILVIALLVLWLVWTLISLPFRVWGKYRSRKGRARLIEGLRAADHGQWQRAERLLVNASEDEEVSGIALASAVRVADARGDDVAANALVQQLSERDPTAHALLQGERHLARQRPVEAINALDIASAQPLPARGLLLRTHALAQIGRADEAYGQLGALRQQAVLAPEAYSALEATLAEQTLLQADDANALAQRWEALPKSLRTSPAIVAAYAQRAAVLHWDDAAVHSLEQALDTQWDESLVRLYGVLPLEKYDSRRASAQRWLTQYPDSPGLLLTLARLARHQQQESQAEEFLHRAVAAGAGSDAWEELGHGFAAAGDLLSAQHCYANALRAARGEPVREGLQPQQSHAPTVSAYQTPPTDPLTPDDRIP
ncbi:heme biosynthesis HemY N-terminal domain-containing protein [Xanthomonas sp. 3075]|uniref:heme biosynthesis protein HemY n=1 Tax=Xanthomonas sp. 3075 TaxID=3035315 RepID=UPI00160AA68C|nr:heme biosynthesis HemY N-terminal domain-containing protein [Xanthomonas sp. 3075]MBB4132911.1 HemY protein [Xanthomonas sp. 3075]